MKTKNKTLISIVIGYNFFYLLNPYPNTAICKDLAFASPYKEVKPSITAFKSPYMQATKLLKSPYKTPTMVEVPLNSVILTPTIQKTPVVKVSTPAKVVYNKKPVARVSKPKQQEEFPVVEDYFTYNKKNIQIAKTVKEEDPKFYQEMYKGTAIYNHIEYGKDNVVFLKPKKKGFLNLIKGFFSN